MKRQPHSWMEYQYRMAGANDNHKMWIRDNERIHHCANGSYIAAIEGDWLDEGFSSFEEAQKFLDEQGNDNKPL